MGNMYCEDCKSTAIKSRTNYTHGKKSRSSSTTTFSCKKCGSYRISVNTPMRRRRK